MTNKEAIANYKYDRVIIFIRRIKTEETHEREIDRHKAFDLAIEALEKQIPRAAEHEDGAWSICPNCGGSICNDTEHAVNKEVSYCEHCGQAIDWGK